MKEIIVNNDFEKKEKMILLLEDGIILEKYNEKEEITRLEGNIYVGKTENLFQGMQAAFVNIGENKNAFIHASDIVPKIDITKEKNTIKEYNIKNVVKSNSPILVQVKKDAVGKKGPRVTTHISLPTRFIVFMPNTKFITVSQKISDVEEKNRLISIVKSILPKDTGAIIRTSALNQNEEIIRKDIEGIIIKWNEIKRKADDYIMNQNVKSIKPKLIYKGYTVIEKMLIDLMDQDIEKITVNEKNLLNEIKDIIRVANKEIEVKYEEKEKILDKYTIYKQLEKIENRKVWLKCGGFITIDKTEALTAVDVNSGKYTGNINLEKTVLKVNEEAGIEIAKQIRLRDIGGIVIIDFIDMKEEKSRQEIINVLKNELKKDRSKTQVVGFSKLNLLEMTRKHMWSSN